MVRKRICRRTTNKQRGGRSAGILDASRPQTGLPILKDRTGKPVEPNNGTDPDLRGLAWGRLSSAVGV